MRIFIHLIPCRGYNKNPTVDLTQKILDVYPRVNFINKVLSI